MASLFRSSLTYSPGVLVPRMFSYSIIIIFTRLFAPAEFGIYALIITYGEVLDSVFMNWSRLGMLRFLRKDGGAHAGGLIKANLFINAAALLAGLSGAALLSLTMSGATHPGRFFFSLALYLTGNSAMRFGLTILRADGRQKTYTLLEVIRPSLSFACIFLAIPLLGLSYSSLVLGFFGVTALFGFGTVILVTRKYRGVSADWFITRQMLRYALPLVLIFFLGSIIKATDRYMLNALSGTALVGLYAASYSLSRPALELLFNAVNLGSFPKLIDLYETKGAQAAADYLRDVIRIQIFFGLPMVAGITVLAQPVANIMLGEEFRRGAAILMPLIAMAGFLAGLKSFAFDQVFHLRQRPMTLNATLLVAAIMNVVLNYFFILRFGVFGVAWATLLSYLLALLLSMVLSTRLLPLLFPVREAGITVLASLVMIAGLTLIRARLPDHDLLLLGLGIPGGVLAYFLTARLLGARTVKNMLSVTSRHGDSP